MQGEPLSPLLFCAGIAPLIQAVADYFPQVEQLWYLDDGLLYGDAAHVSACLVLIQKRLQLLNLELNLQKCELYTKMEADRIGDLGCVPRVLDTTEWSYLGAPLGSERHSKAGQSALERTAAVTAAITKFGEKFPLQDFSLLRYTVGACRIQHLCQALSVEELCIDVVLPCRDLLLRATQALLAAPLNEKQWTQATLPSRNGGIGFGDPTVSAHAARLAMLVNTAETILDLGVKEVVLKAATEAALLSYNTFWGLQCGLPAPAKTLQRKLTAAVHDLKRAKLAA